MTKQEDTVQATFDSPAGRLLLTGRVPANGANGIELDSVSFTTEPASPEPGGLEPAVRQLAAYFAGDSTRIDVARAPRGTPFQRRVWAEVDAIPYGTTISYGELARRAGVPKERVRAVAAAVAANPLLVVRPCHRVIGAGGALTGYAGGVPRKRILLEHEGVPV